MVHPAASRVRPTMSAGAVAATVAAVVMVPPVAPVSAVSSTAPPYRQSSAALREQWDPHTLASFSLSQLDALTRIDAGWCPLLSRAVRCARQRVGTLSSAKREQRHRELVASYLDEEAELARRQALRMLKHVWRNYESVAFGQDELKPVSGQGANNWGGIGQTLVDALDTLWLSGLREEFDRAADWVEANLTFHKDLNVNFFETSIRHLGGLVSAYWFSRRDGLLAKAQNLGDRLSGAYRWQPARPTVAANLPINGAPAQLVQSPTEDTPSAAAQASQRIASSVASITDLLSQFGSVLPSNLPETSAQGIKAMLEKFGLPPSMVTDFMNGKSSVQQQVAAAAKSVAAAVTGSKSQHVPLTVASTDTGAAVNLLPFSDINLQTGEGADLASFVSLAETYMPVEWKALSLFTGNCSYANQQNQVLRIVNFSSELHQRGFAPIMLKPDGSAFPSSDNRISIGGRGDSFYEYLIKDVVFSGHEPAKRLWRAFCRELPSLLVQVDVASTPIKVLPEQSKNEDSSDSSLASVVGDVLQAPLPFEEEQTLPAADSEISPDQTLLVGRWRKRWRKRLGERVTSPGLALQAQPRPRPRPALQPIPVPLPQQPSVGDNTSRPVVWRGIAGARGGWYETSRDVVGPWIFLKEVTYTMTVPKMDHLICFLPGALALDVFHHSKLGSNLSNLEEWKASELAIAHKLAQTCVHMYFRTATDMAPEITRFDLHGLVDDVGSMHSILRPETIESLTILWKTTKAQIYRNWGQRIMAAFGRMRTPFGYASLHNVNRPWDLRDDMPSFFVAETLKYMQLLFADDSVLPLEKMVLNTEAHPLPTVVTAVAAGAAPPWQCDKGDEGKKKLAAAAMRSRKIADAQANAAAFAAARQSRSRNCEYNGFGEGYVVVDQGLPVGSAQPWSAGSIATIGECARACNSALDCNSVAKCENPRLCYLKTINLTGTEPIRQERGCQTFYTKGGCSELASESEDVLDHEIVEMQSESHSGLPGELSETAAPPSATSSMSPALEQPSPQTPSRDTDRKFTDQEAPAQECICDEEFPSCWDGDSRCYKNQESWDSSTTVCLGTCTKDYEPPAAAVVTDSGAGSGTTINSGTAANALGDEPDRGDPSCWMYGYSYQACCFPPPLGNFACWDQEYTYARCCDGGSGRNGVTTNGG